jgi:hypothetical protein
LDTQSKALAVKTQLIGLAVLAIRERIWADDIPVVQFPSGRKMFIDTKDLESFISENKKVLS